MHCRYGGPNNKHPPGILNVANINPKSTMISYMQHLTTFNHMRPWTRWAFAIKKQPSPFLAHVPYQLITRSHPFPLKVTRPV